MTPELFWIVLKSIEQCLTVLLCTSQCQAPGGRRGRGGILTKIVKIDMGILTDDTEIRVLNFDSISKNSFTRVGTI